MAAPGTFWYWEKFKNILPEKCKFECTCQYITRRSRLNPGNIWDEEPYRIVSGHKPLTIVLKLCIIDVWMGPGYVSGPSKALYFTRRTGKELISGTSFPSFLGKYSIFLVLEKPPIRLQLIKISTINLP